MSKVISMANIKPIIITKITNLHLELNAHC